MGDDEMIFRVYGAVNIIPDNPAASAAGGH